MALETVWKRTQRSARGNVSRRDPERSRLCSVEASRPQRQVRTSAVRSQRPAKQLLLVRRGEPLRLASLSSPLLSHSSPSNFALHQYSTVQYSTEYCIDGIALVPSQAALLQCIGVGGGDNAMQTNGKHVVDARLEHGARERAFQLWPGLRLKLRVFYFRLPRARFENV